MATRSHPLPVIRCVAVLAIVCALSAIAGCKRPNDFVVWKVHGENDSGLDCGVWSQANRCDGDFVIDYLTPTSDVYLAVKAPDGAESLVATMGVRLPSDTADPEMMAVSVGNTSRPGEVDVACSLAELDAFWKIHVMRVVEMAGMPRHFRFASDVPWCMAGTKAVVKLVYGFEDGAGQPLALAGSDETTACVEVLIERVHLLADPVSPTDPPLVDPCG